MKKHIQKMFLLILLLNLLLLPDGYSMKIHTAKRRFHKTILLDKPVQIQISHKLGNVFVAPTSNNQLEINAEIKVSSKSKALAESYLKEIEIDVSERKTNVKISSDYPNEKNIRSASINFTLTIPEKCPIRISNSFGDVLVGDTDGMKGGMDIKNGHGEIALTNCEGEAILINKFGSLNISNHSGDVSIESSNSKSRLNMIRGNLSIENSFGKIEATNISGSASILNSNDDVILEKISGQIDIKNSFGDIDVSETAQGLNIRGSNCDILVSDIKKETIIRNTFGDIQISKINSNLTIDSQNSIIKIANVKGETFVENSFGAVQVENIHAKLTIKNPNGNISAMTVDNDIEILSRFSSISLTNIAGNVDIVNSNGTVIATSVTGNVDIENSFGPVRLTKIGQDIRVDNGNGSIRIKDPAVKLNSGQPAGKFCSNIDCSTSFGSIHLVLPQQASIELFARTTWGQIDSEFPIQVEEINNAESISGKIGNGDTVVKLVGKNSNIYLLSK